jgi:hypothetical protein
MVLWAQALFYVAIVRYSVLSEYQPVGSAVAYGAFGGVAYWVTNPTVAGAVRFGIASGFILWVALLVLRRLDGVSFLWWPVFVGGLLAPPIGGFAVAG